MSAMPSIPGARPSSDSDRESFYSCYDSSRKYRALSRKRQNKHGQMSPSSQMSFPSKSDGASSKQYQHGKLVLNRRCTSPPEQFPARTERPPPESTSRKPPIPRRRSSVSSRPNNRDLISFHRQSCRLFQSLEHALEGDTPTGWSNKLSPTPYQEGLSFSAPPTAACIVRTDSGFAYLTPMPSSTPRFGRSRVNSSIIGPVKSETSSIVSSPAEFRTDPSTPASSSSSTSLSSSSFKFKSTPNSSPVSLAGTSRTSILPDSKQQHIQHPVSIPAESSNIPTPRPTLPVSSVSQSKITSTSPSSSSSSIQQPETQQAHVKDQQQTNLKHLYRKIIQRWHSRRSPRPAKPNKDMTHTSFYTLDNDYYEVNTNDGAWACNNSNKYNSTDRSDDSHNSDKKTKRAWGWKRKSSGNKQWSDQGSVRRYKS